MIGTILSVRQKSSYIWDGGVESWDLEIGVRGRGPISLHGYQPGRRHLVGILAEKRFRR